MRLLVSPTLCYVGNASPRGRCLGFGRCYVFKGRKNVNVLLVQRGAASFWYYQGDRGRYADDLLRAAERAHANTRGAWGACDAELTPENPFDPRHESTGNGNGDGNSCHPSYEGACLDPSSADYDCAGGDGNGPDYTGPVRVVGPDDYDLDREGDGLACESS
jgi:hypothetical protein